MEADTLHDLTAAYALDALDPEDARRYEEHLARCERCRAELATLSETAGALAYAADTPVPPPALRERILQQARRERTNVVPLRPRWAVPAAAAAAVAACAAIAFGVWAATLSSKLDSREAALAKQERVAQILAQPNAKTIAFDRGTLVVTPDGDAVLVVRNLARAGEGRTYEAWVANGAAPQPAGLFDGGDAVAVPLEQRVPSGASVLVTEEKAGGVTVPTQRPFLRVQS